MNNSIKNIRFIGRDDIDRSKWDALVFSSSHAHIYSTSRYLDLFTANWGAFVLDDYSVVMPVPFKKKWGWLYTYTPVGIAQLGIIGDGITEQLEQQFIQALHNHFRYGLLHLGPSFSLINAERFKMNWKTNFVLALNESYDVVSKNYTKDARKNLRAANEIVQNESSDIETEEILDAFIKQYGERGNTHNLKREYEAFAKNLDLLCENGMAFKLAIRDDKGELLAAGVFANFRERLYYVFGAPTPKGRAHQSTHVLIDCVVQKYAGTNYSLDFEGSSIPSVAMFYKKFSPVNEPYPVYRFNHLPAWIKWLKK